MLFSSLHLRLVDKSVVILEGNAISEEMLMKEKEMIKRIWLREFYKHAK